MGLATSHDAFHGPYSAFHRWRCRVAQAAGYALYKDQDFHGIEQVLIDWGHTTEAQCLGRWESTPADPLLVLIIHSDCEGVIRPAQALPLADRLEALLPLLDDKTLSPAGSDRTKTELFIRGLRRAAAADQDVEFY